MGPWLRRKDSNLQSPDPESGGLPISRLLNAAWIKLKELAWRVKLGNEFQRSVQALQRALPAQDGDHVMNSGAHGAAGQSNAHGLSELAHRQAVFAERGSEGLLDRRVGEFAERCEFVDQALNRRRRGRGQKFLRCFLVQLDFIGQVVMRGVDELDESFGALLQGAYHF